MRRRFFALALLVLAAMAPAAPHAAERERDVHEVQAAFLFRFLFFVQQEGQAWAGASEDPLELLVLGENPFGPLWQAFEAREVGGRPIHVQTAKSLPENDLPDLIYISASQAGSYRELLASLRGKPTLTVSELSGFARSGGCIEFQVNDGRLGFVVNRTATRQQGLELSSALLRVARTVMP